MTDLAPLHIFRFQVEFHQHSLDKQGDYGPVSICGGSFTECSGLEATMEPKVIKEGGRNYGAVQRAGPVTFATVILKRGVRDHVERGWNKSIIGVSREIIA